MTDPNGANYQVGSVLIVGVFSIYEELTRVPAPSGLAHLGVLRSGWTFNRR